MVKNVVRVDMSLKMEMFMKEGGKTIYSMGMESIMSQMERSTKECG